MKFPVQFSIGPFTFQAHLVLELLAWFVGSQVYWFLRRRWADPLDLRMRLVVIAGAAAGALIGSKVVAVAERTPEIPALWNDITFWMGGKSIVGGLLGGLVGVEWIKRTLEETRSTGDLFVLPLCAAIAVGRVGCFLSGLDDHTYGTATSLPWGIDFGDGIPRHPTQLYEIVALGAIALWAVRNRQRMTRSGDLFRGFMILYLVWRSFIDCWKPDARLVLGLTGIQLACVCGLAYYARDFTRVFLARRFASHG